MPRELVAIAPRQPVLREYEEPELESNQIRIQTEFSAPKHGTELHLYGGKSPYQHQMLNREYRVFLPKESSNSLFPMRLGNMSVGTVVEVGREVSAFKVGDRVFGHLHIRETHTVSESRVRLLPEGMTPEQAVCLDPAHFAFVAVRDAQVRLADRVAISGLGAIGLLAVQMAKLSGAEFVAASDPISLRRKQAERFGADLILDPTELDVGLEIKKATDKRGVDVAIEASGSHRGLQAALRCVHYSGLVVTLGYYKGEGIGLRLGEEWHHNRITLLSSMPVWDNPSRDYPMWSNQRVDDALMRLMLAGKLSAEGLVQPIVPFEEVSEAYEMIDEHPESCIKLGVRYGS